MFRHLQLTLIGAAALAGVAAPILGVCWAFTLIPNHPYTMSVVVFILLSWGIGLFVTDSMK